MAERPVMNAIPPVKLVGADGQPICMVKVGLPLNLWGWICPQCERYTEALGRGLTIVEARCEYCGAGHPEAVSAT